MRPAARGGGPARRPPPGAARPRTYPVGRVSGAPTVAIAEGGGQRPPAGRQLRPRCCGRNPEPGAVRPSRGRGGRGGARRGRGRRRGRAGPRSAHPRAGAAAGDSGRAEGEGGASGRPPAERAPNPSSDRKSRGRARSEGPPPEYPLRTAPGTESCSFLTSPIRGPKVLLDLRSMPPAVPPSPTAPA